VKQLTITLNGKTYTAPKPKVKLWRQIAKFQESSDGKNLVDVFDDVIAMICEVFNNPEITPESIEENMDLDEILPTWYQVVAWVNNTVNSKLQQLPNAQTPAAN
jgi:hypothetical protein